MKRILSLFILIAGATFGLTACLQDEDVANSPDGTTVAVASTGEVIPAVAVVDAAGADTPDVQTDPADVDGTDSADAAEAAGAADDGTRGPISILGNADFTAENGVVGGTGTTDDPYIIAGWEITVPSGEYYGVRIENVTAQFVLRGLIIQNATAFDGAGIRVGFATGGAIEGCSVSNSMNGIDVVSSTDLSIENCVLYVSGRGLRVVGEDVEQYRHEIATSNLYNNSPIYYYYGLDGETITGLSTGHLTVAGSRNVTISNNEVVNGDGLMLAFVEDSTVTLNLVHRTANVITEHGIHLYESRGNNVTKNLVKNNRQAGIQLTLANGNTLTGNFAQANDIGIRILASDDNVIQGSDVFANVTGILLLGGSTGNSIRESVVYDDTEHMARGIVMEAAFSNSISQNLLFGAEIGIVIEAQASGNTIADNTAVSGGYGLYVSGTNNTIERNLLAQFSKGILFPETFQRSITQGNTFRGNVLADNGSHVYTNLDSNGNRFAENVFLNDGQPMVLDQGTDNVWTIDGVGNFWGSTSVADANGDGIGDAPVTVYPSAVDDTAPLAAIDAREIGLGIVGTLDLGTTTIETKNGDSIQVAAYVADEHYKRSTGFRGFPSELITGFPGIFFIFDTEQDEKTSAFTMQTVPFDLDIAFFNAAGEWVGSVTMVAQATALYTAGAPYQYALELPSGSLAELGIGAGSTLELP